jgi:hypothetical protein
MRRVLPPPALDALNRAADSELAKDVSVPAWRYYVQTRDFLYPLERVCGSEKEVDAMRANGAARRARSTGLWFALAGAVACLAL